MDVLFTYLKIHELCSQWGRHVADISLPRTAILLTVDTSYISRCSRNLFIWSVAIHAWLCTERERDRNIYLDQVWYVHNLNMNFEFQCHILTGFVTSTGALGLHSSFHSNCTGLQALIGRLPSAQAPEDVETLGRELLIRLAANALQLKNCQPHSCNVGNWGLLELIGNNVSSSWN